MICLNLLFNFQIEHTEKMAIGDQKSDTVESPESSVTPEQFAEIKQELEQVKQQLEKEKKEKEELNELYDKEVKAKEEAVNRLRHLKAETLRLAIEEKGKFEATILEAKWDLRALQEEVVSLTQELHELRMEDGMNVNMAFQQVGQSHSVLFGEFHDNMRED